MIKEESVTSPSTNSFSGLMLTFGGKVVGKDKTFSIIKENMKDISTDAHIVPNITKTKGVCITTQKDFTSQTKRKKKILQNKQKK